MLSNVELMLCRLFAATKKLLLWHRMTAFEAASAYGTYKEARFLNPGDMN